MSIKYPFENVVSKSNVELNSNDEIITTEKGDSNAWFFESQGELEEILNNPRYETLIDLNKSSKNGGIYSIAFNDLEVSWYYKVNINPTDAILLRLKWYCNRVYGRRENLILNYIKLIDINDQEIIILENKETSTEQEFDYEEIEGDWNQIKSIEIKISANARSAGWIGSSIELGICYLIFFDYTSPSSFYFQNNKTNKFCISTKDKSPLKVKGNNEDINSVSLLPEEAPDIINNAGVYKSGLKIQTSSGTKELACIEA